MLTENQSILGKSANTNQGRKCSGMNQIQGYIKKCIKQSFIFRISIRITHKNFLFFIHIFHKKFLQKPSSRRCQNAYRKWHIESTQHRPIFRVGLDCAHGKHCNRFGVCTNDAALSSRPQWLSTVGSVPFVVITLGFFCFVVAMSIREISAPFCY